MERITFNKDASGPGITGKDVHFKKGEKLWIASDNGNWSIFNNALDEIPLTTLTTSELRNLDLEWGEGSLIKKEL